MSVHGGIFVLVYVCERVCVCVFEKCVCVCLDSSVASDQSSGGLHVNTGGRWREREGGHDPA